MMNKTSRISKTNIIIELLIFICLLSSCSVSMLWNIFRSNPAPDSIKFMDWSFNLPEGNWFYQKDTGRDFNTFGFLALTTGLDWYYQTNNNLSFKIGIIGNFILPIPVSYDPPWIFDTNYMGEDTTAGFLQASLMNYHIFGNFDFGYGLSYVYKNYHIDQREHGEIIYSKSYIRNDHELDIALGCRFKWNQFIIGLNYLTTLVELSPSFKYNYSHLIYFEIGGYFEFFRSK
jgi:hypothetical protein